jgi:hypothetical protein
MKRKGIEKAGWCCNLGLCARIAQKDGIFFRVDVAICHMHRNGDPGFTHTLASP